MTGRIRVAMRPCAQKLPLVPELEPIAVHCVWSGASVCQPNGIDGFVLASSAFGFTHPVWLVGTSSPIETDWLASLHLACQCDVMHPHSLISGSACLQTAAATPVANVGSVAGTCLGRPSAGFANAGAAPSRVIFTMTTSHRWSTTYMCRGMGVFNQQWLCLLALLP